MSNVYHRQVNFTLSVKCVIVITIPIMKTNCFDRVVWKYMCSTDLRFRCFNSDFYYRYFLLDSVR